MSESALRLTDDLQSFITHEALKRASAIIAGQAEELAEAMEEGSLSDRDGPAALRLLAAVIRAAEQSGGSLAGMPVAGTA